MSQLERPSEAVDLFSGIDQVLDRRGVFVSVQTRLVAGRTLSWCTTVGLRQFWMPEVVAFGMPPQVMVTVLDHLTGQADAGQPGAVLGLLPEHYFSRRVFAMEVPMASAREHCGLMLAYYAHKGWPAPEIAQWVIADTEGRFPWHEMHDQAQGDLQLFLGHVAC